MRILFKLALGGALVLGHAAAARAQGAYAGGVPYGYRYGTAPPASAGYSRGYAFKDEPLMSINRSYLGYSNFVYHGPDPALGASTTYAASRAPAPGYVRVPAPARRGLRLFGWRRGYRY